LAKQVTSICDWRDHADGPVCGKPAPYDATFRVDGMTLTGDLCLQHKDLTIERLRLSGMVPHHIQLDGKPRQTYITASGKVVSGKDIRAWAMDQNKLHTTSGRLPEVLIQEYLAVH